jgi:hypothetical protein
LVSALCTHSNRSGAWIGRLPERGRVVAFGSQYNQRAANKRLRLLSRRPSRKIQFPQQRAGPLSVDVRFRMPAGAQWEAPEARRRVPSRYARPCTRLYLAPPVLSRPIAGGLLALRPAIADETCMLPSFLTGSSAMLVRRIMRPPPRFWLDAALRQAKARSASIQPALVTSLVFFICSDIVKGLGLPAGVRDVDPLPLRGTTRPKCDEKPFRFSLEREGFAMHAVRPCRPLQSTRLNGCSAARQSGWP